MNLNEILTVLISYGTIAVTVIGLLAFATSVITQVTKSWGFLDKIPTALQAYVVSLVLTVLTVLIYIQFSKMAFVWYYIVGAIILSFFVSFVTVNGWSQLREIWHRFNDTNSTNTTDKSGGAQ